MLPKFKPIDDLMKCMNLLCSTGFVCVLKPDILQRIAEEPQLPICE